MVFLLDLFAVKGCNGVAAASHKNSGARGERYLFKVTRRKARQVLTALKESAEFQRPRLSVGAALDWHRQRTFSSCLDAIKSLGAGHITCALGEQFEVRKGSLLRSAAAGTALKGSLNKTGKRMGPSPQLILQQCQHR